MQSSGPKISVCIMCYNQRDYIGQCLQSILEQKTRFDFEIVVGDDCSKDGTSEIVREFVSKYPERFILVENPKNIGPTLNYAKIHQAARGEYIAHLDGDDYALPGKLERMADVLERRPEVNVVWHRNRILDEASGSLYPDMIDKAFEPEGGFERKDLLALGSIGAHSAMMYRSVQRARVDYSRAEILDYYIAVECVGEGKGIWIDEFLGVYRINSGVWGNSSSRARAVFMEDLEYFIAKYPTNAKHVNSLLFYHVLFDLKCGRISTAFKLWMRYFNPQSLFIFIANIPFFRHIKISPRPPRVAFGQGHG